MSTKYLLIVCIVLAVIPSQILCQDIKVDMLMQYNKWRFNNKRVYLNEEEQIYRQQVFFDNLKQINEHNNQKGVTYKNGLNQFADMPLEEIKQKILNKVLAENINKVHNKQMNGEDVEMFEAPRGAGYGQAVPQSVDWRTKGVIGPIKHQGQCGSCWTFATTGAMETFNAIKTGKYTAFSEQQLVDCVSTRDGYMAYGCQGGYPQHGLHYASRYGILSQQQYPYVAYQQQCRVTSKTQGFFPKAFQQVPATTEGMKSALATSAVSVLVEVTNMFYYAGGVFNNCRPMTQFSYPHAVVAIGYDTAGNWLIRNSWGTTWGEAGYMRLAPGNTCGVLLSAFVVTQ